MKIIPAVLLALVFITGCGENNLVQVKVIGVNKYISDGWHTRFGHITVERMDTGERKIIMTETLGNTGDVFMVRESFLTN